MEKEVGSRASEVGSVVSWVRARRLSERVTSPVTIAKCPRVVRGTWVAALYFLNSFFQLRAVFGGSADVEGCGASGCDSLPWLAQMQACAWAWKPVEWKSMSTRHKRNPLKNSWAFNLITVKKNINKLDYQNNSIQNRRKFNTLQENVNFKFSILTP